MPRTAPQWHRSSDRVTDTQRWRRQRANADLVSAEKCDLWSEGRHDQNVAIYWLAVVIWSRGRAPAILFGTRTRLIGAEWEHPRLPDGGLERGRTVMEGRSEIERHFGELAAPLDQANCGLLAADEEGDIVYLNGQLREWLGYEPEEVVGRPARDLVPEELRSLIEVERMAVQRGDIRARLLVLQRKNSTTFPAILLPRPFFHDDGRFAGGLSVIVELATIQTAKPVGAEFGTDIRADLHRIALEIQAIGLAAGAQARRLPLEHPSLSDLSEREREVLTHLVGGDRVPAIAKKLHISPHTVRNHLKSLFRKLDVSNQSELIERVQEIAEDPTGS